MEVMVLGGGGDGGDGGHRSDARARVVPVALHAPGCVCGDECVCACVYAQCDCAQMYVCVLVCMCMRECMCLLVCMCMRDCA